MSFISKWYRSMTAVPKRVLFLAVVFGVSSIYVSQEVGMVLAQTNPPGGNSFNGGPGGPPPQGGNQGGGNFNGQPMQGGQQMMQQPGQQGQGQPGQFNGERKFDGQPGQPGQQFNNQPGQQPQFGGPQQGSEFDKGIRNQPAPGMQGGQFDQGIRNQPAPGMQGGQFDQGIRNQPMPGQPQGPNGQKGPQGQGPQNQNGMQPFMGGKPGDVKGNEQFKNDEFGEKKNTQFDNAQNNQKNPDQQQNNMQSDDKSSQQDAQREAQMKRQFEQQKAGLKQFSSMLKKFSTRVATLEKQGVVVPSELKGSLTDATGALTTILAGTSMEDDAVQQAMDTLQASNDSLREWAPKLDQLAQFPRIIKQINAQVKKFDATSKRLHKGSNDSSVVADFDQTLAELKSSVQSAQGAAASGDIETAMDTFQNDVRDQMDSLSQLQQTAEALKNAKSAISKFNSFITRAARNKGVVNQVAEMRVKVGELKLLLAEKSANPEDVSDLLNGLFETQSNISEAMGGAPQNSFDSSTSQTQGSDSFNFQLPSLGDASGSSTR